MGVGGRVTLILTPPHTEQSEGEGQGQGQGQGEGQGEGEGQGQGEGEGGTPRRGRACVPMPSGNVFSLSESTNQ